MRNTEQNNAYDRPRSKKRRVSKAIKAMLAVITVLALVFVGMVVYAGSIINRMRLPVGTMDSDEVKGIAENDEEYNNAKPTISPIIGDGESKTEVFNVILYGIDARDSESFEGELSDTMILVQMNTRTNTIKMVSFLRDIQVSIPGHGQNRLNTCYRFGGHALAQEVFKSHFGVDVDYYAVVNFWSFAKIVDILGGVEINVEENELSDLANNLNEINVRSKTSFSAPKYAGLQRLNGAQTVAYARIRKVANSQYGGSDFGRTGRQRAVISAILKETKQSSVAEVLGMLDVGIEYVRTNIPFGDIVAMAKLFMSMEGEQIQEFRVPADDTYYNGTLGNSDSSVLKVDFDENVRLLREFLQN